MLNINTEYESVSWTTTCRNSNKLWMVSCAYACAAPRVQSEASASVWTGHLVAGPSDEWYQFVGRREGAHTSAWYGSCINITQWKHSQAAVCAVCPTTSSKSVAFCTSTVGRILGSHIDSLVSVTGAFYRGSLRSVWWYLNNLHRSWNISSLNVFFIGLPFLINRHYLYRNKQRCTDDTNSFVEPLAIFPDET